MKWFFLQITLIFFMVSCITTGDQTQNDVFLNKDILYKIEQIESLTIDYLISQDKNVILQAAELCDSLVFDSRGNKKLESKALGLKSYVLFYSSNNISDIKIIINEIKRINSREEYLFVTESLLQKNLTDRINLLENAINKKQSDTFEKIKLLLAESYYFMGRFRDAAVTYDEIFIKLPVFFQKYHKTIRDTSYTLIKNIPKSNSILPILISQNLTVEKMIIIFLSETSIFSENEIDSDLNSFFLKLKKSNFFSTKSDINSLENKIKRKDIVFFLLQLLSRMENNPDLIKKYQNHNIDQIESPIPDVNVFDYYYTSVLVLLEREIIDLPDGVNFFPNDYLEPHYFYLLIKKL